MTMHRSTRRRQPYSRWVLVPLMVGATLAGSPRGAEARTPLQEIRISVAPADLADPRALAELRRRIAIAAASLCPNGGLAETYRAGAKRCRAHAIAAAEQQLRSRSGVRLADRSGDSSFDRQARGR